MTGFKFYSKPKIKRPEAALQRTVVEHLRFTGVPGMIYFSLPNEGKRSVVMGAELKRMGMRAGAADLCVIVSGRAHFLELKSAKGKQSLEQKAFEADAVEAGCNYVVANNIGDALGALQSWGAIRLALMPRQQSEHDAARAAA